MGAVIAFPVRDNGNVKEYIKTMNENNKGAPDFVDFLNAVSYLENLLEQSGKHMEEMKNLLDELTEIQKHPIKTELNKISTAVSKNSEAAKSWFADIAAKIVDFCKKALEDFKAFGVSALDKTVSLLHLKEGFDAISGYAAQNNELCGKAVSRIDAFSAEYHKGARSFLNMGRIAFGKEPVDKAKENGKLAAAVSAPYRASKSVWAKIERMAYGLSKDLGNFHTRAQTARENRREAKEALKERESPKIRESPKTQKTDIFKAVEKHKETAETANKNKPREAKKSKDER